MIALGRCSVHVLPVAVSSTILWVTFKQVFIGIDFRSAIGSETINVALLQTAAKVQELLIIASLAAVAFQLLRYELIHGNGLPLGLLAAGFDFTKLSWLWSAELHGSLRTSGKRPGKLRRAAILLYLIMAAALVVLAGPSCAVLLIPQSQDWPAGRSLFYLKGNMDQIWPTSLSATSSTFREACVSAEATTFGICPGGGYYSIWTHYTQASLHKYKKVVPPYARQLSGDDYYWSLASSPPVSTRTISLGIWNSSAADATQLVQPRLGVSVILERLMEDWWQALQAKGYYASDNVEDRAASSHSHMPMTSVKCSAARNMSAADKVISFPILGSSESFEKTIHDSQDFDSEPSQHLQFRWVSLPEQGRTFSTGAIFQSPWTSNNQSRIVVGCAVQAQWIPAEIHSDGYSFWQGWYPKELKWADVYPNSGQPLFNGSTAPDDMKAIAADVGWLESLHHLSAKGNLGIKTGLQRPLRVC
ncbi:MAG: hypothetical protein L6R35_006432 [Caloplaca aegaea]|nr:MAG: hypothetical protein L6R35_006432 [Caloplaca aegaea]